MPMIMVMIMIIARPTASRHCGHRNSNKPEAASTHKSAKTHAGNAFLTCDLDLWHFNPK